MTEEIALIAPLPQAAVQPQVEEYAPHFSEVLCEALEAYRRAFINSPEEFTQLGASARGVLVADLVREPALRIFGAQPGAEVDLRHGYPWVSLDGGRIQVRFKKLAGDLSVSLTDTERSRMLSFHLGDPCLPGFEPATVLTAGYVLDESGFQAERFAIVCHIGTVVHYAFNLPSPSQVRTPRPEQLPVIPLSPPMIRSAQLTAEQRIKNNRTGSL